MWLLIFEKKNSCFVWLATDVSYLYPKTGFAKKTKPNKKKQEKRGLIYSQAGKYSNQGTVV